MALQATLSLGSQQSTPSGVCGRGDFSLLTHSTGWLHMVIVLDSRLSVQDRRVVMRWNRVVIQPAWRGIQDRWRLGTTAVLVVCCSRTALTFDENLQILRKYRGSTIDVCNRSRKTVDVTESAVLSVTSVTPVIPSEFSLKEILLTRISSLIFFCSTLYYQVAS